ncbi:hypothetical protein Save01_03441 [Streptomyces avermitilis]
MCLLPQWDQWRGASAVCGGLMLDGARRMSCASRAISESRPVRVRGPSAGQDAGCCGAGAGGGTRVRSILDQPLGVTR